MISQYRANAKSLNDFAICGLTGKIGLNRDLSL